MRVLSFRFRMGYSVGFTAGLSVASAVVAALFFIGMYAGPKVLPAIPDDSVPLAGLPSPINANPAPIDWEYQPPPE